MLGTFSQHRSARGIVAAAGDVVAAFDFGAFSALAASSLNRQVKETNGLATILVWAAAVLGFDQGCG